MRVYGGAKTDGWRVVCRLRYRHPTWSLAFCCRYQRTPRVESLRFHRWRWRPIVPVAVACDAHSCVFCPPLKPDRDHVFRAAPPPICRRAPPTELFRGASHVSRNPRRTALCRVAAAIKAFLVAAHSVQRHQRCSVSASQAHCRILGIKAPWRFPLRTALRQIGFANFHAFAFVLAQVEVKRPSRGGISGCRRAARLAMLHAPVKRPVEAVLSVAQHAVE